MNTAQRVTIAAAVALCAAAVAIHEAHLLAAIALAWCGAGLATAVTACERMADR